MHVRTHFGCIDEPTAGRIADNLTQPEHTS
jgi:hypothetical protein